MSLGVDTRAELMAAVPVQLRSRIVSGMRWTVWATVLTAPLGYCVSILLARIGPEAIGAYGLTGIYSWFASTFLFLGGGAVVMKFTPAMATEKRLSFLVSYLLVVLALALPWQVAGTLHPSLLHYVFGNSGSLALHVLLLWVAPLYVFYLLVSAALSALLEIRYQQLITRFMSVAAFVIYAGVYFLDKDFLAGHYIQLIWTTYLGLAFVVALAGGRRVIELCKRWPSQEKPSLFLPAGFWRYTLGVQANSMLGLFASLAGIFTLNVGGVAEFGRFVALMAIAALILTPVQLILANFLPSLTNAMQAPDSEAASAVASTWSRLLLACCVPACVLVSAFAAPLVRLLGHGYAGLVLMVPLACASAGINALNQLISSILYAVSRPYANAAAQLARLAALCACFWPLWARYRLLGAVLAWFISEAAQCAVGVVALSASRTFFKASLSATLGPYSFTLGAVLFLSRWSRVGPRIAICVACIPAFFLAARYSLKELRTLARLVLPSNPLAAPRITDEEGYLPPK